MDAVETRKLLALAHERVTALAAELAEARRQVEHLETALQTNRQIAIALGIVMAQRGVTSDAAFDFLRATSQRVHRPIRELADEIVYTGQTLADDAAPG